MFNKVVLIGRLTKNPELKQTNGGIPFVTFSIAVNRPYSNTNDSQGSNPAPQQDKTLVDFFNCIAWRRLAENTSKYTFKGSLVAVEGRIQNREYTDTNNVKRTVTDIVCDSVAFLDSKAQTEAMNAERGVQQPQQNPYRTNQNQTQAPERDLPVIEDDLPF